VEALRALLVGTSTILWLDFVVLADATVAGITASSLLLPGWRGRARQQDANKG
jgi:hypothetical protein